MCVRSCSAERYRNEDWPFLQVLEILKIKLARLKVLAYLNKWQATENDGSYFFSLKSKREGALFLLLFSAGAKNPWPVDGRCRLFKELFLLFFFEAIDFRYVVGEVLTLKFTPRMFQQTLQHCSRVLHHVPFCCVAGYRPPYRLSFAYVMKWILFASKVG